MAICRTINPFTCQRDLHELDMLILARTDLMVWIQLAKESRYTLRCLRRLGYADDATCIKSASAKHENNIRVVGVRLDDYRFRCRCAGMNIKEATAFRNRLMEYISEY